MTHCRVKSAYRIACKGGVFLKDKCYICYGDLTALTTASNGVINYKDGEFALDKKKWTMTCYHAANSGANCIRLIPYGVWLCPSKEAIFTPFKFTGIQWNLDVWNPQYFMILQKVVSIAASYGLTVWFDLFDHCQAYTPENSPYWNNVQGYHGFYDSKCDDINRNWILSIYDILKNVDAIFGCGNEMEWAGIELCTRVIYPKLKQLGVHPSKIAYGTHYQLGSDYTNKTMEWMKRYAKDFWGEERNYIFRPVHGILASASISDSMPYGNYVSETLDSWGNSPLRIAYSDDGTWDGKSGCDFLNYNGNIQRRPDADIWKSFCENTMRSYSTFVDGYPKFLFEHCPKSEDVAGCQVKTLKAMAEAYMNVYGCYPSNYNKYDKPVFNKIGDIVKPVEEESPKSWYLWASLVLAIILIVFIICC